MGEVQTFEAAVPLPWCIQLVPSPLYNGQDQLVRISVDVTAGDDLMEKPIEPAKALLEEMTSNYYHRSSERATPKKRGDKYKVDAKILLASRVAALV